MVCAAFKYVAVSSYGDAVRALTEYGDEAKILAGGQSLVSMLNLRLARPSVLIDINPIDAPEPQRDGDRLVLSAMTRYSRILASETARRDIPLLTAALANVGNVRVRNRGTVGGTLAHCEATSEVCVASLALSADITAQGPTGPRTIRAEDFFLGFFTTVLEPDEVVTEIRLPVSGPGRGWSFLEMVRRSSDYAIVDVGVSVVLDTESGDLVEVRVGLGGVGDRPVLAADDTTRTLVGQNPTDEQVDEVACAVAASTSPRSDLHASGSYRKRLVRVLTRRALIDAVEKARASVVSS